MIDSIVGSTVAVLEILATMREVAKKQDSLEAKEAAEKARNHGLTDREKAELETKRAEIARIEARTLMSEERTARETPCCRVRRTVLAETDANSIAGINEMVAKLAERTDKADRLLQEIAKNVQEGKKTRLDPALSEEVKKLLRCAAPDSDSASRPTSDALHLLSPCSGVRTGVDEHVKDFRGQLTSEVSLFCCATGDCVAQEFACSRADTTHVQRGRCALLPVH